MPQLSSVAHRIPVTDQSFNAPISNPSVDLWRQDSAANPAEGSHGLNQSSTFDGGTASWAPSAPALFDPAAFPLPGIQGSWPDQDFASVASGPPDASLWTLLPSFQANELDPQAYFDPQNTVSFAETGPSVPQFAVLPQLLRQPSIQYSGINDASLNGALLPEDLSFWVDELVSHCTLHLSCWLLNCPLTYADSRRHRIAC